MSTRNEPLVELVDRDLESAVTTVFHPAQIYTVREIERLLLRLDASEGPVDLYNFQVDLFHTMHLAQMAQAAASRAMKRVKNAKAPDFTVDWPIVCLAASSAADDWEMERRVAERAVRQIRAVGDALAWRTYRFDRRAIIALSQNAQPGPFVGKKGLDYEIGAVQDRFERRGNFALLHDLTNVLRIGDLTECHASGYLEIDEIKASMTTSASAKRREQMRPAQEAIDSMSGETPLVTGTRSTERRQHLWSSSVEFRSELHQLEVLAQTAAGQDGWAVKNVGQGRVLAFMDFHRAAARDDPEATLREFRLGRSQVLERAGHQREHLLQGRSADYASLYPSLAPASIFPLPARLRAELICDQVVVETFIPVERAVRALEQAGCAVEVLLRAENTVLDEGHDVLVASRGSRRLLMHGPCTGQLLQEVLDLSRWARACRELLDADEPAEHPVLVFSDEDRYWTRKHAP